MARVSPVDIPAPVGLGRDTVVRRAARAALASTLWDARGRRRLPAERALVAALEACDPRDVWWVCEMASVGPVYLLPTRPWVRALADFIDALGVTRVLEVAAGDGFLSRCLRAARPALTVVATDSGGWARPEARMREDERRTYRGVAVPGLAPGGDVERLSAARAVAKHRPELVVVSWAPPGTLVERVIRQPVRYVLDLGVDGDVCGNGTKTWRFQKELLDGPIESRALCRLDARPRDARHTRATLYYGGAHPEHGVERHPPVRR